MLRNAIPFLGFLFVSVALFVSAENHFAPTFKKCIGQEAAEQASDGPKGDLNVVVAGVEAQGICTLRLVDRHNGFFAALAGLAVAGFTFPMWRSTEKLWAAGEKQRRVSRQQAAFGAQAARAATETVKTMRSTAERELRAYVNHEKGNVVDWDSKCPILQVSFRNYGQTPAYDVVYWTMVTTANIPLGEILPLERGSAKLMTIGVVGPTGSFQFRLPFIEPSVPDHIRDSVNNGKKGIYCFGKVTYKDAFDVEHWTSFRLIFSPANPSSRDGQLSLCEEGNNAT